MKVAAALCTLRPAVLDDGDALTQLALRSKASNGYDAGFMAACRDELSVTPATFATGEIWIAQVGDEQIGGFAHLRYKGNAVAVEALFIDPDAKRKGLGRMLWAKIEERARNSSATRIVVDSDPAALSFYLAMGCRQIGETPSGSIPGRLLPLLEKRLGKG